MAAKYWTFLCFHSIGDWFQNTIAVINWTPSLQFPIPIGEGDSIFWSHNIFNLAFWILHNILNLGSKSLCIKILYDIYRYINLCLKFTEWDPNFVLTLRDCMYLNFFLMCFFSEFMNSSRFWLSARGSISN